MLFLRGQLGIIMAIGVLWGLGLASNHIASAEENKESGILDGMVFVGKIGKVGQRQEDDKLYFSDGKFWSGICTRCGFQPGNYWTRNGPDGIHFRGEMKSDSGTFHYEGRVIDDKINVNIFWQKERWYWTSSRELSFIGTLKPDKIAYAATLASSNAAEALQNDLPGFCW